MSKYSLTEMAVKMFCPGNVVQVDDAGLPSVLVWIPKFRLSDVLNTDDNSTHPAFIVNGKEIPGFYYSKYQNVICNGKAYSLPAEDPAVNVTFDKAMEYCETKGYGWHLSTAAEWAAIALWCKKNGFLPYGNNDYGKDKRDSDYQAIASNSDVARVATGTGPLTWSHDGTASGIWDMNGNVWEWQGGMRLVWGELQILANNDAADPDNPQNATSTCWKAINAADGTLVDPESKTTDTAVKTSGKTVKLDYVSNVWTYSTGVTNAESEGKDHAFTSATCTAAVSNDAKTMLRALALLPDEGAEASEYEGDYMYLNNGIAECCVFRGGSWNMGASTGVFGFAGNSPRTHSTASVGFRSVYIPDLG
jgi:hypothetical protein